MPILKCYPNLEKKDSNDVGGISAVESANSLAASKGSFIPPTIELCITFCALNRRRKISSFTIPICPEDNGTKSPKRAIAYWERGNQTCAYLSCHHFFLGGYLLNQRPEKPLT